LIVVVHGVWLALTLTHAHLPWPILFVLGGFVTAWHGSLQHEGTHGHPTGHRRVDALLVGAPLSLWLPFARYRALHLAHHRTAELTHPLADPETFWRSEADWRSMSKARRLCHVVLATLAGRLILGPFHVVGSFLHGEARLLWRGRHRGVWARHALLVAAIALYLAYVARMPLATYVSCFVYPGAMLTLLRSYAEHRPAFARRARSALVRTGPVFSLLFLNNNLHAVHHARPTLPWYRLPAAYRRDRARLARGGAYDVDGYRSLLRWAVRPRLSPVHARAMEQTAVAPREEPLPDRAADGPTRGRRRRGRMCAKVAAGPSA